MCAKKKSSLNLCLPNWCEIPVWNLHKQLFKVPLVLRLQLKLTRTSHMTWKNFAAHIIKDVSDSRLKFFIMIIKNCLHFSFLCRKQSLHILTLKLSPLWLTSDHRFSLNDTWRPWVAVESLTHSLPWVSTKCSNVRDQTVISHSV